MWIEPAACRTLGMFFSLPRSASPLSIRRYSCWPSLRRRGTRRVSNAAWLRRVWDWSTITIVAQAVWGMARPRTRPTARDGGGRPHALIALAVVPRHGRPDRCHRARSTRGPDAVAKPALTADADHMPLGLKLHRGVAVVAIILFFALLVFLAPLAATINSQCAAALRRILSVPGASAYSPWPRGACHCCRRRSGSTGWVRPTDTVPRRLSAQRRAMPGPLFTFVPISVR